MLQVKEAFLAQAGLKRIFLQSVFEIPPFHPLVVDLVDW